MCSSDLRLEQAEGIGPVLVHGIPMGREAELTVDGRIEPCQESSAGGTAHRVRGEGIRKANTVFSQPIQHRGLDVGMAVATQLRTIVRRDDEQKIGGLRCRLGDHPQQQESKS